MQSFGLFNGNEVSIVLGVLELKDMRADSFVNLRAEEAAFATIQGSDGSITRYATNNTKMYADLIFKRSSKEHAKLSALLIGDMTAPGGAGVSTFLLKDNNGATFLSSLRAWVSGFPDATHGKDVGGDVTWTIEMQVLPGQYILGGNQL